MMGKYLRVLSIVLMAAAVTLLVGCGADEAETAEADQTEAPAAETAQEERPMMPDQYEDGIYFAQEENFSERTGWKYMVVLEVSDGEIVSVEWDGANRDGGTSKWVRSESGEYGMVENGGAIAPWYEQADAAEAYLLEVQDPSGVNPDDEGVVDAISGATIDVSALFNLAAQTLADGPDGYGMWRDGHYAAEEDSFSDSGWRSTVDLTVFGGRIVAANWDGVAEDGGTNKKQRSMDGEYGMLENGGAIASWAEQARAAENYLIEVQDPSEITPNDEGAVDAISGATINVSGFVALASEALEGASRN